MMIIDIKSGVSAI